MMFMMFGPLNYMKENTGREDNILGQKIISVVVEPHPKIKMTKPVELVFKNTEVGRKQCRFILVSITFSSSCRFIPVIVRFPGKVFTFFYPWVTARKINNP